MVFSKIPPAKYCPPLPVDTGPRRPGTEMDKPVQRFFMTGFNQRSTTHNPEKLAKSDIVINTQEKHFIFTGKAKRKSISSKISLFIETDFFYDRDRLHPGNKYNGPHIPDLASKP